MKKYQKTSEEIIAYNNRIAKGGDNQSSLSNNPNNSIKKYWNFFPTPKSLIEKMLEEYKTKPLPRNILEPSAGKGDIIDYINKIALIRAKREANNRNESQNNNQSHNQSHNQNNHLAPNIYCYEIVPELQEILRQKKCQLLGDDFLNHRANIDFDLIIMNPPFDQGANHILHSWDILAKEGQIIALLNKHTYYNAYNSHRLKFRTLVDQFGKIENLGRAFGDDSNNNVERTAKVDVIMITITKRADRYYQDIGINLNLYPNSAIKENKAEYVIRELPM